MRVLVACEFSGVVRDAFRARGHDAVSCDLLPSERPGPHIVGDVRDHFADGWDLLIAHPPFTFLANSGAKHLYLGCRREFGAAGDRWANLGHAAASSLTCCGRLSRASRSRTRSCSGMCGGCSTFRRRRRRSSPGSSVILRPRRPACG
jgi:hypothetical protein